MKKIACYLICLIALCLVGCNTPKNDPPLYSGDYWAVGDYERGATPYLRLNTEKREFTFCEGALVSYAENGTYSLQDGELVATTQNLTFRFEIKDERTLVLIDEDACAYFEMPVNTQFEYSEELK